MDNVIHPLNNWALLDFEFDTPKLPRPHHYVRIAVNIGSYINDQMAFAFNSAMLDANFSQNFLYFSVAQRIYWSLIPNLVQW